jgi:DNA-directed RNA polymerase specialized sigma24 family protein
MSCDPDFQAHERLIQQLYGEHGKLIAQFVYDQMHTCYVPGQCSADVAQKAWIAFANTLSKDGYAQMLLDNETPEARATRLRNLLFTIVSRQIANHFRKNGQKWVRAQVNADFTANSNHGFASHNPHQIEGDAANAEQILQDLLHWTATCEKATWEVAGSIVGIINDNDYAGKWTCEELAAEVTRRLGRRVTIHKVRHARTLLLKKARSMPELQPFIFRYES